MVIAASSSSVMLGDFLGETLSSALTVRSGPMPIKPASATSAVYAGPTVDAPPLVLHVVVHVVLHVEGVVEVVVEVVVEIVVEIVVEVRCGAREEY